MQVIKNETNILLKNANGEYHFSIEDFNKHGEEKAKKIAEEEINKKLLNKNYTNVSIDFNQARDLGFCEYGIKDFCNQLELDIEQTYSIKELFSKLTLDVFIEYSSECSKLFGKDNVVNKFGGVKKILDENRSSKVLNFILSNDFLPDKTLHILACDFAEKTLPNFENEYPDDDRPRKAIEVKRLWIEEEYK